MRARNATAHLTKIPPKGIVSGMRGTAVTLGNVPRALAGAGVRSWTLPWLILLLSLGVIGMHSLGASHHPPVTTGTTTSQTTAASLAMASMASMAPSSPAHAPGAQSVAPVAGIGVSEVMSSDPLMAAERTSVSKCATCELGGQHGHAAGTVHSVSKVAGAAVEGIVMVAAVMGGTVAGSHGLMVMCLAVLPLLGLVLRRAGKSWGPFLRNKSHMLRSSIGGVRDRPAAGAAVSLARLCISRT